MPILSPQSAKELCMALQDAFPSYHDLERMVKFDLGLNLKTITSDGNISKATYELLEWAEARWCVGDLIRAARSANQTNGNLQRIAGKLLPTINLTEILTKQISLLQPMIKVTYWSYIQLGEFYHAVAP